MKPLLLIDFDGTLCHDRFWRSIDPEVNQKIQNYLFGPDNRIVARWMKGGYISEDINLMLSQELGLEPEALWSLFVRDCETMAVEKDVLDKIEKLRERYIVMLVTDNMDCFNRFTVPALGLANYFDGIYNSYHERVSKNDNDGELFLSVVKKNKGEIKDSMLIDNSRNSCEIFKKLGGQSLFVTKEYPIIHWLEILLK